MGKLNKSTANICIQEVSFKTLLETNNVTVSQYIKYTKLDSRTVLRWIKGESVPKALAPWVFHESIKSFKEEGDTVVIFQEFPKMIFSRNGKMVHEQGESRKALKEKIEKLIEKSLSASDEKTDALSKELFEQAGTKFHVIRTSDPSKELKLRFSFGELPF
mgnify:CR=1 FL=1